MKKFLDKICVVYVLLILSITANAQQSNQFYIDSLKHELTVAKEDTNKVNLLIDLGQATHDIIDYDKSLEYCKEGLSLSEKLNFKKGQGDAYATIASVYASKGDIEQALNTYKLALTVREKISDKKGVAGTYNNIGIIYAYQDKTSEALKMFFAALEINEAMNNQDWLANNYGNIGLIYESQGNYSEALKMAFASLKIHETLDDKKNIASDYNNIGLLYWHQKNYKEALDIYFRALKIMSVMGDSTSMHDPYNNMAGIYADMDNYPEALKSYKISLKLRKQIGDKGLIADSYAGIGGVYEKMNDYNEALHYIHSGLKLYKETGNLNGLANSYFAIGEVNLALKNFNESRDFFNKGLSLFKQAGNMSEFYYAYEDFAKLDSATANYKSALENYKMYILYRDSAVNQENNKKLIQTQMQYDFDKKEAVTKAQQDKKDALSKEELQKQKLVRNGFVGGFAIMLLFAGVFFTQRNKIKKGKRRSDELLLNILPADTAEELKRNGSAEAKSFDEATVLFTDFKDFTSVSEKMTARDLVQEINYIFSEFDKIISKFNIEKIKTIGDSYMCAGGLPVPNKTNATDVVNAALDIQKFVKRLKEERDKEQKPSFEIRIGIHTGAVVAGIVGIKKFAYDIWGDTVNIASRMESSGQEGKVNISGTTYELMKNKFTCTYRGKIEAKHKGEIDMYFVEDV